MGQSPGKAPGLEFGHLTRLGQREAKGLTHTSPGQRPGKKQRIWIEGQRPVSYYIDTQEELHRTKTFQEEYRELLRKYHIEFDERYVWD